MSSPASGRPAQDLAGRIALVTGGARGVGKAITTALALRGAHVLVNYFHSHDQAKATQAELRELGCEVSLLRASVARPEQVTKMFAEIERQHGRLDILVNNAADGALVPLVDLTDEHLERALATNVKGGLRCARAAAPLMARGGGGSIVTVSALGGSQLVMANYLACAPAKAAAEAVTRYLAVEFAPLNIRVNTASAAMLTSEVADAFPDAEAMQQTIAGATPLGRRLGTPGEFADVVAFLACDQSAWITGQIVLADGGLSLGAPLLSPPAAQASPPGLQDDDGRPGVEAENEAETETEAETENRVQALGEAPALGEAAEPDEATAPAEAPDPGEDDDAIAVVGMGLAVSGANSPGDFWQLRTSGGELFTEVPADRWRKESFSSADAADEDKSYQDTCVFITDFRPEPAALEGADGTADDTELTTQWLRHSLVQALDGVHRTDRDRFSFHLGYTADGSQHLEEAGVLAAARHMTVGITGEMGLPAAERERLTGRVDKVLSGHYHRGSTDRPQFLPHQVGRRAMRGILPDATQVQMVDTACSSSLYAIDIGVKDLLMGRQDIAVCGGAFALAPRGTVLFSKLKGLSKRGAVHALDAAADGVIFADGAGVVVLKKMSRALADGDRVLGVLKAFGSSSDGRGKAIYAPSAAGQNLAVERALAAGELTGADIDWVNAHATGTPAGDLAEFTTLRGHYGVERAARVTSNKSLIGHTGWAAGVVSLIESILAMRERTIPGQYRFRSAPEQFELGGTKLEISGSPADWPAAPGRPRTAAVSGFGFGGTNAHLIVTEPPATPAAPTRSAPRAAAERIVIVGWSAKVPWADSREELLGLLNGPRPERSGFGETYPAPPFQQVRMPPATVRTIDRCQLMILACAHELRDRLPEFWQEHTERTGVVVGHMGPTRAAMLYANRCYLDDIERTLGEDAELAANSRTGELAERLRERVRSLTPPSNEDSFPGMMPNVISARVANHFDLKGPNITVDAGLDSTASAFATAARYLHSGELDFVLAGGINGNSLAEYGPLLADVFGHRDPQLAEGAFLFGLTTQSQARRAGLEVLAFVDEGTGAAADRVLECGAGSEDGAYLGAAGALGVLRALSRPTGTPTEIRCGERGERSTQGGGRLLITPTVLTPDASAATSDSAPAPVAVSEVSTPSVSPSTATDPATDPGTPGVRRYVSVLRPAPADGGAGEPGPAVPDGAVVLTDRPELAERLAAGAVDVTVLTTTAPAAPRPGVQHVAPTEEAVAAALARLPRTPSGLVVAADLTASSSPATALTDTNASLTDLHDLTFLVLQQTWQHLNRAAAGVLFVLLGAVLDEATHPLAGLFTGLAKCTALELSDAPCLALLTATREPAEAARLAADERGLDHAFPVVHHDGIRRLLPALVAEDAAGDGPHTPAQLGPDSVVVALGGARGITAELLTALAERHGCHIYALGSNPLDDYPAETFAGTDAEFAATRAAYITRGLRAREGTVADISRRFDRMLDARTARRNLARLAAHSGSAKVSYLTCDSRDEQSVRAAIDTVHRAHGRIDLLVNAPGLNRSAAIRDKAFAEFRTVRDLKVLTHRNLHRALAGRAPGLWCDFGSLLGYFGQRGEADYASGNDFLATAAAYAAATTGTDEFVIGWTLWDEVGMGANELTRDYFKRAGSYSHMPVGEGVRHFLAELTTRRRAASLVHLGAAEHATVDRFYPGFLAAAGPEEAGEAAVGRFYLRRTAGEAGSDSAGAPDTAHYTCLFGPDTDAYLDHHRVRGVPTLPGTFVTEIAAEAALDLVPGRQVVAFEDVRFLHFLQVHPGIAQQPKKITARLAGDTGDLTTVQVDITYDVVAPSGVLLARDKPHFTARVLLAPGFPDAPRWQHWDDQDEHPVPDPYHVPGAPVELSGPFRATTSTRSHPRGARAEYRPRLDEGAPWRQFVMPAVLLDALARTGVLAPVDGLVPVAAPLSIRRIDLYQRANDRELAARHGHLELYAVNPGFGGTSPAENRFVAVTHEGRVVAQMKGIDATVIGHLDTATETLREPGPAPAAHPAAVR
ncbi:SDR family oxidoreductase [Streptomyces xanthochromogenes]|uniref:SDR family oxidoreductase n=1 Tax=Streptomyces xanthochromogenes TaxID=67384 RepID=UPI00343A4641